MSNLEKLIAELCPNGVEYFELNRVFMQFNGMTGVSNKWAESGNCKFIDYLNAYKNWLFSIKKLVNVYKCHNCIPNMPPQDQLG